MQYYILTYFYAADYMEKRAPIRQLHFDHVNKSLDKGEFVMGGALDPPKSAVLIFKVMDPVAIETFVKDDPYIKNGLVTSHKIEKWNVVIGKDI